MFHKNVATFHVFNRFNSVDCNMDESILFFKSDSMSNTTANTIRIEFGRGNAKDKFSLRKITKFESKQRNLETLEQLA